jgi:hypothetical protein
MGAQLDNAGKLSPGRSTLRAVKWTVHNMVDKDGQDLLAQCKLCLKERHLQKSHLVPRAYYKLLRPPGADDPNPITADAETTRTSQEQLAKHLLCASCEDLLNKNGERWVLLNNYRLDGPSPLY